MITVLLLLTAQGILGAFDTLYYHEYRARLTARIPQSAPELKLHAARSLLYSLLFGSLPWVAWEGFWVPVLILFLTAEIFITLKDFAVEDEIRIPLGGVFPGERTMHTVMAMIYGAMLSHLLPLLWEGWKQPTGFSTLESIPKPLSWILTLMAIGAFISGMRDLLSLFQFRLSLWPWKKITP